MPYQPNIRHRRSIRLPNYDYASVGAYFVTICTHNRTFMFGNIVDGEMRLNRYGQIASEYWNWLGEQYPYVEIDQWVVMPNHMHGIIIITDDDNGQRRGGSRTAPTSAVKRKPLGRLVGAFKTTSTKRINIIRNTSGAPVWQRNYYEHVIRNEDDLQEIREYIVNNPAKWAEDKYNPGT